MYVPLCMVLQKVMPTFQYREQSGENKKSKKESGKMRKTTGTGAERRQLADEWRKGLAGNGEEELREKHRKEREKSEESSREKRLEQSRQKS